jgi:hypothetical protein
MGTKETRTQYTLEQKRKYITEADVLVAGGMQLKEAAKKLGINDAYIHTWKRTFKRQGISIKSDAANASTQSTRNGVKIPSLEQKQKWVTQVDELRRTGLSVKDAIVKVGIRPDDYYRYKHQIAKANGTLPVVAGDKSVGAAKDLQMLQFDMGTQKSSPMVLMIGNAEDFKSTLAQLGQILRGN